MGLKHSSSRTSSCPDNLPWTTRLLISLTSFALHAWRSSQFLLRITQSLEPKSPPSPTKPLNGVVSSDLTIDPFRNLWYRFYLPTTTTSANLPLIVYFHGGGFLSSAPNSIVYDSLCRTFSRDLQSVVVSINYRLAPKHRYPSQYDDGFDALKFIDSNVDALPSETDLNRCFLAGDSAGGNIAHHVAIRAGGYEFERVKIVGLVAIQPFFGGEERMESEIRLAGSPTLNTKITDWMWRSFLPEGSDRNHEAVNVSGEILKVKFPATVVFVGGYDPLQDWQRRYSEGLEKSGKEVKVVEYPNAIHGFYIFQLNQLHHLTAEIREFILKQSDKECIKHV